MLWWTWNELGKAEDTVDNDGINEKWEFKAAFIGTKFERCGVDHPIVLGL